MENKILEKLINDGQTSLVKDVLPEVINEFADSRRIPADADAMQTYITQLLGACHAAGIEMICVPVLRIETKRLHECIVEDMIYKKLW